MIPELELIFEEYENIVSQVDQVFESVCNQFPECISCKKECSDCCHALFDLTLVEAIYINYKFMENISETKRALILEEANKVDRKLYRLKRDSFRSIESGDKTEDQVLFELAAERSRCPLLNNENLCDLYKFRPITCRLYGIPTSIGGRGHTCGLSMFKEGQNYPTVNLDAIYLKLNDLSSKLVKTIKSSYTQMDKILMPLSMSLLTVFDESYLGVKKDKE